MQTSESTKNLLAALCAFQGECPTMPKDKSGFNYRYTNLDTIVSTIKPLLKKNGLGFMQPIFSKDDGSLVMTTRIFNKDGEYIETDVILQSVAGTQRMNNVQQLGAGVTYMRRYALCSMLGITSDEDADGEIREDSPKPQEQNKPASRPAPNAPQKAHPKKPVLAGGEATKEESETIKALFASTYEDGAGVFTKDEMKAFSNLRTTKTAAEVIAIVQAEVNKRLAASANQQPSSTPEDLY